MNPIEHERPEKLSLVFRLSFGMGNMLNILGIVGMWFPYGPTYLSKVLKLERAGTVVLVAQVAGGVFAPIIGVLCDICPFYIYGRRKTWHLLGLMTFALSFFFLWHDCFSCDNKYHTIYYSLITIPFQFGYSAMQIAQLALVPELAPTKQAKVELNSIRFIFQAGGTLLALAILWVLLVELPPSDCHSGVNSTLSSGATCHNGDVSQLNETDQEAFWVMALIVIGLGFLMSLPFHIVFREKYVALKKLKWYQWLLKPNFYLVIVTYCVVRIIIVFTQQNLPFFFLDTLSMHKMSVSIGPLVLYAAMFAATLTVKKINKAVGENMMYFLGVAFVWASLMWFWLQPSYPDHKQVAFYWKRDIIYIAMILLGIGGATLMVISLSMISILIGEFSGSSAFVYGWVLLADRVSNGILNQIVLTLQGRLGNFDSTVVATQAQQLFSRNVIVFTPFAATALGLVALGLIALWDYQEKKMIQSYVENKPIQIRDTAADRAGSFSSVRLTGPGSCCSCCYSHRAEDEQVLDESERRLLVDSCHEKLRDSTKEKPVNYGDLECSLVT